MQGYYCCFRCDISSTGGERVSDTIQLFPRKIVMTSLSSQDEAIYSIYNIITILRNPVPATPFLEHGPKATTEI